jgi:hypothetical protein
MTVYKISYWIGDDEGTELNLITEMATTDAAFAAESIKAIAYGIEEGDPRVEEIEGLKLKVMTLDKMLRDAERELSNREESLTLEKLASGGETAAERFAREAASLNQKTSWDDAKSKLQEAFNLVADNAAEMVRRRAQEVIDAQPTLDALQENR